VIFGKKGRTTIPLPLREKLGWQAGDTISFRLDGDRVIITRQEAVARHQETAAAPGRSQPRVLVLLIRGGGSG
jgi:AbrB family looped-hinge helix DNA binding protein